MDTHPLESHGSFHVYPGRSISDAIRNAPPCSEIVIHAGHYGESISINRPLTVVGDDSHPTVDGAVLINARGAIVRRLSLVNNRGATVPVPNSIVRIFSGEAFFDDCRIATEHYPVGVHVLGQDAILHMTSCSIRDCNRNLLVTDSGTANLKDCDIHVHHGNGIRVRSGGRLVLHGCSVHNGGPGSQGLDVADGGIGSLEACQISQTDQEGILVGSGGIVVMRHTRVHDKTWVGVSAGGRLLMEDCELLGNTYPLAVDGIATIVGCGIHSDKFDYPILVSESGRCQIENSVISDRRKTPRLPTVLPERGAGG